LLDHLQILLHPVGVARFDVLHRLVDDGHTVVVIEHNLDIMAEADCIVDIGPEAGSEGGRVVAYGTPEEVASQRRAGGRRFWRGCSSSAARYCLMIRVRKNRFASVPE